MKVSEEEDLVLDDRPAYRAAKLVPAERRHPAVLGGLRSGVVQTLAERIAGFENVVLQELKQRSVKLVRARLRLHLNHRSAGLRELRIVIGRGELEFLHRVDGRIDHDDAQHRVVIVGAVDHEIIHPE